MFIKHGDGKILNIVKDFDKENEDDKKIIDDVDATQTENKNSTSNNVSNKKNFRR